MRKPRIHSELKGKSVHVAKNALRPTPYSIASRHHWKCVGARAVFGCLGLYSLSAIHFAGAIAGLLVTGAL